MRTTFCCANERCQRPLDVDHVTLVTTTHVRRFCTVECISAGQDAIHDAVVEAADRDYRAELQARRVHKGEFFDVARARSADD